MTERSGQTQAGRSQQGYVSASESRMRTSIDQIDLDCLRKAQRGCKESRSLLAKQAKGKVQAFINRIGKSPALLPPAIE